MMMPAQRIWGLVYRHLCVYRGSWPRLVDLAYWPVLQMIIWGFTSHFFAARIGNNAVVTVGMLLGGVLLWEMALRSHLGFAVTFMEEVWSRNLGHIFISPLRPWEMLSALTIMSALRMMLGVGPAAILAFALYHFSLLTFGPVLVLFAINLMVMGWWIALGCIALILSQGGGAESLVWSMLAGLTPFACVYYPRLHHAPLAPAFCSRPASRACLRRRARHAGPGHHPLGPSGLGRRPQRRLAHRRLDAIPVAVQRRAPQRRPDEHRRVAARKTRRR